MTNDNLDITNAQVAEASALAGSLDALFDDEGNLIPNPTQEDWEKFSQLSEDVVLDVANTSH